MAKKVIKLTEGQLAEIIKDVTLRTLNEMDGATYARIYNDTHKAQNQIQNKLFQRTYTINNKTNGTSHTKEVNNDDVILRARELEQQVQKHWLKDFIGKTFMFFGEDRLGLVAHVLFTFEKVTKLDVKKTILVGTVTYNDEQISGDGIIIDFSKPKDIVKYKERGSRYAYKLEADVRTSDLWNKLLEQLKMALFARK